MSHVPKAFCFCGGEMKNIKTGVIVEAILVDQDDRPYYKISCDIHECVDCGNRIFNPASAPSRFPHDESYDSFKDEYTVHIHG